ncbi:hypothetical protein OGAPHI_005036 [Ogataea philodendri]|uniref:Uncharacterized protein n=1 Tax=Ogataea philodendri TaxID=1378263 RepID=A0A9P8T348_9ASCO|nr:uncharacterized protein OGAPHI_005036 [Ogataea philodendri]KAH3663635.1 hypothetical protein OGAPHI_005036 [Ogataea philodendri]
MLGLDSSLLWLHTKCGRWWLRLETILGAAETSGLALKLREVLEARRLAKESLAWSLCALGVWNCHANCVHKAADLIFHFQRQLPYAWDFDVLIFLARGGHQRRSETCWLSLQWLLSRLWLPARLCASTGSKRSLWLESGFLCTQCLESCLLVRKRLKSSLLGNHGRLISGLLSGNWLDSVLVSRLVTGLVVRTLESLLESLLPGLLLLLLLLLELAVPLWSLLIPSSSLGLKSISGLLGLQRRLHELLLLTRSRLLLGIGPVIVTGGLRISTTKLLLAVVWIHVFQ